MLLDVLLDYGQRRGANRGHEIASAPEHRLTVPIPQSWEFLPQQPARHRFEVVGHDAGRGFRIKSEQQVDMIGFTVHLDQLRLPVFAKAEHDLTESLERRADEASRQYFVTNTT